MSFLTTRNAVSPCGTRLVAGGHRQRGVLLVERPRAAVRLDPVADVDAHQPAAFLARAAEQPMRGLAVEAEAVDDGAGAEDRVAVDAPSSLTPAARPALSLRGDERVTSADSSPAGWPGRSACV